MTIQVGDSLIVVLTPQLPGGGLTLESVLSHVIPDAGDGAPVSMPSHSPVPVPASRKTCCRCGKTYGVTSTGRYSRTEGCHYHFDQVLSHKVLGGLERRYSCCRGVLGSPGCQVAKCYAAKGLELTLVTVMDPSLQVVCDAFVKPDEEVVDCNTRFSGVVEDDLKNMKTSVHDVQTILLNLFSADLY
ncbi:putative exonuclease GOR [Muntiacus reevesi]|uniref:putative exonuclease GOR n=1 Tax=Muntiacus reevesi TaxID=9886 RepID=UPI003307BA58